MTSKPLATLSLLVVFGSAAPAFAAGSKEDGQAKSATCVACHGVDGNSPNPEWPNLAGQHATYIEWQLKSFQSSERQNDLMTPMAMILSDQDVADVAAYFSSQAVRGGETEPSKLAIGQRVYRSGNMGAAVAACAGCHGPAGRGNPLAGYPSIQGQHATYVAAQLRAYQAGSRKSDPNQMMRIIAARLSPEEIDAVASYVQGLR
jgi:cytochrome c553